MAVLPLSGPLRDVVELCQHELGPESALEAVAAAAASACESSLRHAETFHGADPERAGQRQLWDHIWLELGRRAPECFSVTPGRLTSSGHALAYALAPRAERGLEHLELTAVERSQEREARRFLYEATRLPALARPSTLLLVTDRCLALRGYGELTDPEWTATACAYDAPLRRHVLVSKRGLTLCRAHRGPVSHLALTVFHEEVHLALSSATRLRQSHGWSPLSLAGEEAVVSALDLAAERYLKTQHAPSLEDLIEHASDGCYSGAVRGLLTALRPRMSDGPAPLLQSLARLGQQLLSDRDADATVETLNRFTGASLNADGWLSRLPLA